MVPSDVGPLIARRLRLESIALLASPGGWRTWGPLVVAITNRPEALGVGGLLGVDFLARFQRVTYEFGPPDTLILDEDP